MSAEKLTKKHIILTAIEEKNGLIKLPDLHDGVGSVTEQSMFQLNNYVATLKHDGFVQGGVSGEGLTITEKGSEYLAGHADNKGKGRPASVSEIGEFPKPVEKEDDDDETIPELMVLDEISRSMKLLTKGGEITRVLHWLNDKYGGRSLDD